MSLTQKKCVACEGGVPHLTEKEIFDFLAQLKKGWTIQAGEHVLTKEFTFKNFKEALAFTNQVGAIAEAEGHHPEIILGWGKVKVSLWTHAINGLTENDFIVAAKIDQLS